MDMYLYKNYKFLQQTVLLAVSVVMADKNLPQNRSLPRTEVPSVTTAADEIAPSTPFRI
jgi:hypothetical protein